MELVVEPYAPGDEKRMMEIAPRAFEVWARYGIDYSLPRERVDEAYRLEAQGYADRARRGDEGFAVFTAKREGLLIGYIVVCVDPHRSQLFGLRWGVIVSLAVDPDFHHQGTGKALVRRAMEWFREQGCEYLEVTTDLNNVAAIRTYEGAGFRAIYASITLSQHIQPNPLLAP